jgi:hypothetical protein
VSEDTGEGNDDAAPDREATAIDRTLDLFVFAPVGLVLTAVEDLPGLIAKGRQRVETEVRNARVVGEFVVTQGQQEVTQRVGKLLHGLGQGGAEHGEPSGEPSEEPVVESQAVSEAAAPPAAPKPAPDPADGEAVERALAGYDTLSASQVVRRLESLGPEELRAVYRHEASHRNRRTILNRTGQLLEDSPTASAP